MRIEYALSIGDPRSVVTAAIQARSTGPSHIDKEGVKTAMGICQSRCAVGMALLNAKYRKDHGDTAKAISSLQQVAVALWVGGDRHRGLAGCGKLNSRQEALAVRGLAALAVEEYCRTADTPGAKCRCGGRGVVEDPNSREFPDEPGIKTCPRCHGTGLKPLPASRVYRTVAVLLPELTQSTFYAKWKLVYDLLVERCSIEEGAAKAEYHDITRAA